MKNVIVKHVAIATNAISQMGFSVHKLLFVSVIAQAKVITKMIHIVMKVRATVAPAFVRFPWWVPEYFLWFSFCIECRVTDISADRSCKIKKLYYIMKKPFNEKA